MRMQCAFCATQPSPYQVSRPLSSLYHESGCTFTSMVSGVERVMVNSDMVGLSKSISRSFRLMFCEWSNAKVIILPWYIHKEPSPSMVRFFIPSSSSPMVFHLEGHSVSEEVLER